MNTQFTTSIDGTQIAYVTSGAGDNAFLFSHGWLGNKEWWIAQEKEFSKDFRIVRLDLGNHGESGKRADVTATKYAQDIIAVAKTITAKNIILVGHSMSGAYAIEASPEIKNLTKIILVDTLKDIQQTMEPKIMDQIFAAYKRDFPSAVKNELPKFLYGKETPPAVMSRLEKEFLHNNGETAAKLLAPLYRMDLPALARAVTVPVRAINSDFSPTNESGNKKVFRDFAYVSMKGTGHYPMLERAEEFNQKLRSLVAPES